MGKEEEEEEEEEEHRNIGKTNSSRPTGPYKAVCCKLHYLIYSERHRIVKAKAPPHPPLPPAKAGRKDERNHTFLIEKKCMEILIGTRKD